MGGKKKENGLSGKKESDSASPKEDEAATKKDESTPKKDTADVTSPTKEGESPTKTETAPLEPGEYRVERIIKKRVIKGKTEYFLKWVGYSEDENTWEPVENLDCPDRIDAFEESLKKDKVEKEAISDAKPKRESAKRKRSETVPKKSKSVTKKSENVPKKTTKKVKLKPKGFSRGLDPERVIGAVNFDGQIQLLVKWKGNDEPDLVPSHEANARCPQKVISFYEERLIWHTHDEDIDEPSEPKTTESNDT